MRDLFTTLITEALTFARIEMDDNAEALLMQMARLALALPINNVFVSDILPAVVKAMDEACPRTPVPYPDVAPPTAPIVINKRETFVSSGTLPDVLPGVIDG